VHVALAISVPAENATDRLEGGAGCIFGARKAGHFGPGLRTWQAPCRILQEPGKKNPP